MRCAVMWDDWAKPDLWCRSDRLSCLKYCRTVKDRKLRGSSKALRSHIQHCSVAAMEKERKALLLCGNKNQDHMAETLSVVTWSLHHLLEERKREGEPERERERDKDVHTPQWAPLHCLVSTHTKEMQGQLLCGFIIIAFLHNPPTPPDPNHTAGPETTVPLFSYPSLSSLIFWSLPNTLWLATADLLLSCCSACAVCECLSRVSAAPHVREARWGSGPPYAVVGWIEGEKLHLFHHHHHSHALLLWL